MGERRDGGLHGAVAEPLTRQVGPEGVGEVGFLGRVGVQDGAAGLLRGRCRVDEDRAGDDLGDRAGKQRVGLLTRDHRPQEDPVVLVGHGPELIKGPLELGQSAPAGERARQGLDRPPGVGVDDHDALGLVGLTEVHLERTAGVVGSERHARYRLRLVDVSQGGVRHHRQVRGSRREGLVDIHPALGVGGLGARDEHVGREQQDVPSRVVPLVQGVHQLRLQPAHSLGVVGVRGARQGGVPPEPVRMHERHHGQPDALRTAAGVEVKDAPVARGADPVDEEQAPAAGRAAHVVEELEVRGGVVVARQDHGGGDGGESVQGAHGAHQVP